MYTLNEIPLSGKAEQKEIHWRSVDFVFRYQAVGAEQMFQFAKQLLGCWCTHKKYLIQMLSN